MPNGKYNAQCNNCDFFRGSLFPEIETSRRWCRKHDFVMPYGASELICSDWLHEGKAGERFANLDSGFLYHYSYQSVNLPDKFRAFPALQNLIVGASIHNDNKLGWVVHLKEEWYSIFPEPDNLIELWTSEINGLFQVLDIQRSFHSGTERSQSGEWKEIYATRTQRILHCPSSRLELYKWINTSIDANRYLAQTATHERAEALLASGFFVYLEIIEKNKSYRLHPDLFYYKEYQRN